MFKKIEIWILYLVLLLSIICIVGFGVLVRQEIIGNTKIGKFDISFLSKPAAFIAGLPEQAIRILVKPNPNRLNDPWDEYRDFYAQSGFQGTPNTFRSYLLLSRYDGDLMEGVVELIDLTNFKILHTWNPDIDAFNMQVDQIDEFKYLDRDDNNKRKTLKHPKLTKDGGLLFGWNSPLRKIDTCSNLVFQNTNDIFHHSIETDFEGNIWAPSHMYPQSLPVNKVGRDIIAEGGFFDDAIVKLSPDGEVLYEKSVSQIFIDNGLEYLLFSVGELEFKKDPIHLNDIQAVNSNSQYWKKGDVFLSLRHQSMVLLYRPTTNKIIWRGTGAFFSQHDVDIIDDHRISIFDNNSKNFIDGRVVDGKNKVVIYNFKTNEYSEYLSDSLNKYDVRTPKEGLNEILPNEDLYIEESFSSRILYFNSDGSLRWSYVNKAGDGNIYTAGWSRILYTKEDINTVDNFINTKVSCND